MTFRSVTSPALDAFDTCLWSDMDETWCTQCNEIVSKGFSALQVAEDGSYKRLLDVCEPCLQKNHLEKECANFCKNSVALECQYCEACHQKLVEEWTSAYEARKID